MYNSGGQMIYVRMLRTAVPIAFMAVCVISLSQNAIAEMLNDLRGLSIKSVWHLQLDLRNLSYHNHSRSVFHVDRNLYISTNGRIFEYQLHSRSPTQKPSINVAELGREYRRPGVYSNE